MRTIFTGLLLTGCLVLMGIGSGCTPVPYPYDTVIIVEVPCPPEDPWPPPRPPRPPLPPQQIPAPPEPESGSSGMTKVREYEPNRDRDSMVTAPATNDRPRVGSTTDRGGVAGSEVTKVRNRSR